jgi:PKD repeat protein
MKNNSLQESIMRTTPFTILLTAVVVSFAACTVKEVDQPSVAGPSTVGYSIDLQSNTNTLIQDGLSQARIVINARDHMGQPMNGRPLRAEIRVGGVVQDFGTLSTKNPVTGSTLIYTAPPPSALTQQTQPISIAVTPLDSGVFGDEFARAIELTLVPQGVILPTNPALVADFTPTPSPAKAFETVTFDASPTTNGGVACGINCTYSWNFGDGTSSTGLTTSHQYRTAGSYPVTLTVTDARGAQATRTKLLTVTPAEPPTGSFTSSPTSPNPGQTVFFNASQVRPAAGRTLVDYFWDFGDGTTGSGVTQSHVYAAVGSYVVTLKVTDDAGTFEIFPGNVTVVKPTP